MTSDPGQRGIVANIATRIAPFIFYRHVFAFIFYASRLGLKRAE